MPDPIAAMAWGMVWDGNAIPKFLFVFSYLGRQLAETEGFMKVIYQVDITIEK
jgi:hypothetical protein